MANREGYVGATACLVHVAPSPEPSQTLPSRTTYTYTRPALCRMALRQCCLVAETGDGCGGVKGTHVNLVRCGACRTYAWHQSCWRYAVISIMATYSCVEQVALPCSWKPSWLFVGHSWCCQCSLACSCRLQSRVCLLRPGHGA